MRSLPCSFLVAAIAKFVNCSNNQTYPIKSVSSGNVFLISQLFLYEKLFNSNSLFRGFSELTFDCLQILDTYVTRLRSILIV